MMVLLYALTLLAGVYGTIGEPETGLGLLTKALTLADTLGQRWYKSELHRLKGELLLARSTENRAEAEACFHRALEVARQQSARAFELRAATSLARLWAEQGRRSEARNLLASVYDWFTEGFETRDLKEAKALLDELR